MARSLRYHPLFASDVLDAAEWYDGRQANLGSDFVVRVRTAVERLLANPERRAANAEGVRYWPIERFPYLVFYDLSAAEVLVLGVMHTARDAEKWLYRRR